VEASGAVIEPQPAVLADDAVHRPHAGDVVDPPGRPTGDGHHAQARGLQHNLAVGVGDIEIRLDRGGV
jgi:hypothetical protein